MHALHQPLVAWTYECNNDFLILANIQWRSKLEAVQIFPNSTGILDKNKNYAVPVYQMKTTDSLCSVVEYIVQRIYTHPLATLLFSHVKCYSFPLATDTFLPPCMAAWILIQLSSCVTCNLTPWKHPHSSDQLLVLWCWRPATSLIACKQCDLPPLWWVWVNPNNNIGSFCPSQRSAHCSVTNMS